LPGDPRWCIDLYWRKYRGRDECVAFTLRSSELTGLADPWVPDSDPLAYRGEHRRPPRKPVPVTTGLVRRLNIASIIDAARPRLLRQIAGLAEEGAGSPGYPADAAARRRRLAREIRRLAAEVQRPARRGTYTEGHYRLVKEVYERAVDEQGVRGAPTRAVAEHFSQAWGVEIPYSTANKWVARARARLGGMEPPAIGHTRKGEKR